MQPQLDGTPTYLPGEVREEIPRQSRDIVRLPEEACPSSSRAPERCVEDSTNKHRSLETFVQHRVYTQLYRQHAGIFSSSLQRRPSTGWAHFVIVLWQAVCSTYPCLKTSAGTLFGSSGSPLPWCVGLSSSKARLRSWFFATGPPLRSSTEWAGGAERNEELSILVPCTCASCTCNHPPRLSTPRSIEGFKDSRCLDPRPRAVQKLRGKKNIVT